MSHRYIDKVMVSTIPNVNSFFVRITFFFRITFFSQKKFGNFDRKFLNLPYPLIFFINSRGLNFPAFLCWPSTFAIKRVNLCVRRFVLILSALAKSSTPPIENRRPNFDALSDDSASSSAKSAWISRILEATDSSSVQMPFPKSISPSAHPSSNSENSVEIESKVKQGQP